MAETYILPLQRIADEAVGGKAEGLALLIRLGLDVPQGFVILHARPGQLPANLMTYYQAIGAGPVAVRSSAIGEDSADASFAGQYETLLNVQGEQALIDAIEHCLASLQNARSRSYRADQVEDAGSEMAVVVQQMVDARVAGVLFTADPVTNSRQQVVVDAVSGLGEKLVSGEATPDHYVLDRDGLLIEQALVGETPLLTEPQLRHLVQQALMAEEKIGQPLDMEWAIDHSGQLRWLQARPITTLGADLNELDTPLLDPAHIYTRCNVSEALPGALCPLTHSVTGRGLEVGMQRMFIDVGILPHEDDRWYVMASFFGHMFMNLSTLAWTSHRTFGRSADDLALAICGRLIPELDAGFVRQPLWRRLPVIGRYLRMVLSGSAHRRSLAQQVRDLVFARQTSAIAQWQMIDRAMDELYKAHHSHLVSSTGAGAMVPMLLGIVAKGQTPTDEHHLQVAAWLAGANDVESADIAQGATRIQQLLLQQLHVRERFIEVPLDEALAYLRSGDSGEAGREFVRYLQRHGHRSISEMDIRMKEWACDPLPLVETLQNAVRGLYGQPARPVSTAAPSVVSPAPGFLLGKLVALAQRGIQGREQSKSHLVAVKRLFKQAYRELAQMMVSEKLLPDSDAVYFLTHAELGEYLSDRNPQWMNKALARREAMVEQQALQFPDVFTGKPVPVTADYSEVPADRVVRGRTVSRGFVVGRARIALQVAEANKLEQGDILIAPITDIAWTPYFALIGGLATDIGSAVSHGAVVAREYGLPAIVKTDIGTRAFRDGELVALDANAGILRPATAAEIADFARA